MSVCEYVRVLMVSRDLVGESAFHMSWLLEGRFHKDKRKIYFEIFPALSGAKNSVILEYQLTGLIEIPSCCSQPQPIDPVSSILVFF